ncbi:MAG: hypothetical protein HY394_00780 [Candidatus Diapherotrites archaeon]|nr:hypothetical protein [Candidatus Diapherotrites archaeon]
MAIPPSLERSCALPSRHFFAKIVLLRFFAACSGPLNPKIASKTGGLKYDVLGHILVVVSNHFSSKNPQKTTILAFLAFFWQSSRVWKPNYCKESNIKKRIFFLFKINYLRFFVM